jgi:hypothetical protein
MPGGRTLIFPGDAQIGNWLSWDDVAFKDDKGNALPIKSKDLLNRAVFYKVGHHGSHNASHRRFVDELMGTTTASMMSFHPVDSWPSIPNLKLVAALDKGKRALVRSDQTMRPPHTHRDGTIASEYSIDLQ